MTAVHRFEAEQKCSLSVSGHLEKGDNWRVRIYQDLPLGLEQMHLLYSVEVWSGGLATFLFGIGFILTATRDWKLPGTGQEEIEAEDYQSFPS